MKKIFMAALFACLAINAYAMEFEAPSGKFDIYTSIRMNVMFQDISGSDSYRDINEIKTALQSNSRAGVKWTYNNIFTQFEVGLNANNGTGINLRLFYAGYKLGDGEYGTIRAGQFGSISDTQTVHGRRFDTDAGLVGFGALGLVRRPGIGYDYNGFSAQLTTLNSDSDNYTGLLSAQTDVRYRELVPKIELAYTFKAIPVKLFGAYAYFTADGINAAGSEKDFNTSAYHAGFAFRPDYKDFYARLSGFYAVNSGLYSMVKSGNGRGARTNLLPVATSSGGMEDVTTYGGGLSLGYNLSSKLSLELGGGYQLSESDPWAEDDDNFAVYINMPIKPVKGIMIVPEIGYLDFMKRSNGSDDAKVIQGGVHLRIDL